MIGFSISSPVTGQGRSFFPSRYGKCEMRTGKHGDSSLEISATVGEYEAQRILAARDERSIVVASDGVPLFRGVISDVSASGDVVELVAFGAWSFMLRTPLSGFWSHTLAQEWEELPETTPNHNNKLYSMDNDNRLYIGLSNGEVYHDTLRAAWSWERPYAGISPIETFSFTYDVNLPSGYVAEVRTVFHNATSSPVIEWQVAGNGAQQTGSANLTAMTNDSRLIFTVYKTGSTPTAYSGETDEFYAYIDSLRIKSTTSSQVDSSEIVAGVWSYMQSLNPNVFTQGISAEECGLDLMDVLYEDATASSIIEALEDAGNSASQPMLFHIDRYGNAVFSVRETAGQVWYADVAGVTATSSLDGYSNYIYTRYENENQWVRRTSYGAASNDLAPGYAVAEFLDFRTTSDAEASAVRDAYLNLSPLVAVKASIVLSRLRPEQGDAIGYEFIRGGDRLVINNATFAFQRPDHKLFYFDVLDTSYDAVANQVKLTLGSGNFDQRDAVVQALIGEFDMVEL